MIYSQHNEQLIIKEFFQGRLGNLREKYIEVMSHYNFILHTYEEDNIFFKT